MLDCSNYFYILVLDIIFLFSLHSSILFKKQGRKEGREKLRKKEWQRSEGREEERRGRGKKEEKKERES